MRKSGLILLSLGICLSGFGQSAPITIDGRFDDWTGLSGYTDAPESQSGIDLLNFQVSNDADFLYVRFQIDQEIDLVENTIPHTLYLQIDTDNNASTGFIIDGEFGSEIGIHFRNRMAFYNVTPSSTLQFPDIQFRALPTVTSDQFEIAIGRDLIPDGINPLFPSPTIRLLFRETNGGDRMPSLGEFFSYTFDETPVPPVPLVNLNRNNPGDLRICAWNSLNNLSNSATHGAFNRLLDAIQPDVIGFSEASTISATATKNLLDTWLPLGTPDGWYVVKDDYDMVTASRYPILNTWPALDRQFPALIDLPEAMGSDLLFINAHYNCCGNDAARQAQADAFIQFVLDARSPGGVVNVPANTPIVLGGDLNLVGYSQQLTTLLEGDIQNTGTYGIGQAPDWDDTPFTDLILRQTDKRMAYTWRSDGQSFPPGRLDFFIYSDAVLELSKGYTLQTAVMSPARLAEFGLQSNDAETVSDHFPIVVDFVMAEPVDSDGDLVQDGVDNCPDVFNPLQEDQDGDGIGDVCEDSDMDGLLDSEEISLGTNPNLCDTDGDGITDGAEVQISGTNPLLMDTNGNNCNDLDELSGLCGGGGSSCAGDLNGDQAVNSGDLVILLAQFGNVCP